MLLDIKENGFSLTDAMRQYTTQRMLLLSADRFVVHANVRLFNINGPRGSIDKCCQIELSLLGKNSLLIADVEANLYVAIDRASARCMRTLARRLARANDHTLDHKNREKYPNQIAKNRQPASEI